MAIARSYDEEFQEIWDSVPEPQRGPRLCADAASFLAWCEQTITPLLEHPTRTKLHQAELWLQRRYFMFRNYAERGHRDYTGSQHVCLYHVWVGYYDRIFQTLLSVDGDPLLSESQRRRKRQEQQPKLFATAIGVRDEEISDR